MSHPIDKLDKFLGVQDGTCHSVFVLRKFSPRLKVLLSDNGIYLDDDMKIKDFSRTSWKYLCIRAELPEELQNLD